MEIKYYSRHPLYKNIYKGMKSRCYNKNNKDYNNYGGRGIYICNEWLNNYRDFVDWAVDNGWKPELHVDRINNDGPYSPDNCRFVTPQENACNKRFVVGKFGYCGVCKTTSKYYFNILFNNKTQIGCGYTLPQEAAVARDKFIVENNLNNQLNFPCLEEYYKDPFRHFISFDIKDTVYLHDNLKNKKRIYKKWARIKKSAKLNDENIKWNNFKDFYYWCLNNGFESNLCLVRKDYVEDYGPNNCEFITRDELNKRMSKNFNG